MGNKLMVIWGIMVILLIAAMTLYGFEYKKEYI